MEKIDGKHIIILVNTYFQIITAIKLKMSRYKNDYVDIIVSDHSTESFKIYNKLKDINIFERVYFLKSKQNEQTNKNKLINNILFLISPEKMLLGINIEFIKKYDEYIFYNIDKYTYLLFDALYKKNNNLKIIRFEEGYISYLYMNSGISLTYRLMRKILNKKIFERSISMNLFFNPSLLLYNANTKIEKIPNFDRKDHEMIDLINEVFEYNFLEDKYSQKYIFFEESFFCDGKDIDDLTLILEIADIVGRENLLVKLHPRNKIDRFSKYGIKTNKELAIPWEVIQMNNDFSDKVFFTISSGSVLASRLYFNDNIKTYLLFNCTDKMSDMVTEKYFEYLKKVEKKFGLDKFVIPKNKKNFFDNLRSK